MADADCLGNCLGLVQLSRGQTGTNARDGHRPLSEGQMGCLGHNRAVDSTGEGDDTTGQLGDHGDELLGVLGGNFFRCAGFVHWLGYRFG